MSSILTLVVVCCVVSSVHPATSRIYFGPRGGDSIHHSDTSFPVITEPVQPGEVRNVAFNLHFNDHDQPPTLGHDNTVNRNQDVNPNINLPDGGIEGPGDILSSIYGGIGKQIMFPSGIKDVEPIEPASGCLVGQNLTVDHHGESWTLLSRGHCAEGEWIVMMDGCQPACQPRPCPQGQLEYDGQCVSLSDTSVCGEGQILYLTLRGTTYCDCEQNHFYDAWKGQCFALRERGACDFGYFLEINKEGNVECMVNECLVDIFEKEPDSGKCFRKDFVGYCPVNSLHFNTVNQTAGCLLIDLNVRNLFDRAITRSCTRGSRIDHRGNCRQELVIPSSISLPRSLDYGCGERSIRIQDGPCRRVTSYF